MVFQFSPPKADDTENIDWKWKQLRFIFSIFEVDSVTFPSLKMQKLTERKKRIVLLKNKYLNSLHNDFQKQIR